MDILFDDKKLQKNCNSSKDLQRKFGKDDAQKIQTRLAQLASCESLEDINNFAGARCHELSQNRKHEFAVDLKHPRRLVFRPLDEEKCKKEDGGLDWKLIKKIVIIEVVDYHKD